MGKSPCCHKVGLKRGTWTSDEDLILTTYIEQNGHGSWRSLPEKAGLRRCGKSCRLRWNNYLRPDIKRGKFSLKEEQTITQLHALLGNRWSTIASCLPKRTDNDIKNFWNTHLKKKLTKMGIDPVTHKPRGKEKEMANISHMVQWERARLQAEARLARDSKAAAAAAISQPLPAAAGELYAWSTTTAATTLPAPNFNAPVGEALYDDDLNELMKLVGHGATATTGHSNVIYSNHACANNIILNINDHRYSSFQSEQNLSTILTGNINGAVDRQPSTGSNSYNILDNVNVINESDEFAWNNVGAGDHSAGFNYEAPAIF